MSECNSMEILNLDNQEVRLNKINEIKDNFFAEIKERVLASKRLSKDIASFDFFDKSLIVLSATSGSISVASFVTVVGAHVVIASLSLAFSLSKGLVKKLLKTTRNIKKKHNKIAMLARSRSNSIESKISETLINNQVSHDNYQ